MLSAVVAASAALLPMMTLSLPPDSMAAPEPRPAMKFEVPDDVVTKLVAITAALKVASPAALPSIVRKVVSAPPSVPLRIISLSLAAASIVMLPELVVMVTAASPAEMSSAAADPPASAKENTPLPFVTSACPSLPSALGKSNDTPLEVKIK